VSAMEAEIPFLKSSPAVEIPGARARLEPLDRDYVPYRIVALGTKAEQVAECARITSSSGSHSRRGC
jgi:hypothetical protein